jgi:hypothetical protein
MTQVAVTDGVVARASVDIVAEIAARVEHGRGGDVVAIRRIKFERVSLRDGLDVFLGRESSLGGHGRTSAGPGHGDAVGASAHARDIIRKKQ